MQASPWNPTQYLKFHGHRLRPALDLLARIHLSSPKSVFDLGCGTGEVAGLMAQRWPEAVLTGVDSSADMLATARQQMPGLKWLEADIGDWQPDAGVDLIYSNAALQWLDDHAGLFPRLASLVNPGGCLAVQMPLSWESPSHRLMRETLTDCGGLGPLGSAPFRQSVSRRWVEKTEFYYDCLAATAHSVDIWETEYLQVLDGDDPVLEWVRATALKPILHGLDEIERDRFLKDYRQRLSVAYPRQDNGQTLYPFRRLFIIAHF